MFKNELNIWLATTSLSRAMHLREVMLSAFGKSCAMPLGSRIIRLWEVIHNASAEAIAALLRRHCSPHCDNTATLYACRCFLLRIAACAGRALGFVLFS